MRLFKKIFGNEPKLENEADIPENKCLENPPELLMVKLFFEDKPVLNDELIEKELKNRFKTIEFPDASGKTKNLRQYFFKDYEVEFAEGNIPAQATILIPDENKIEYAELENSFRQSWNWQEAEETVKKCSYEILLTDLMSRNLGYKERIEFFQKFVASIVSAIKPSAVWIRNSEVILEPEDFLERSSQNNYQNINAFMNVRLFNIQETQNEMMMDTLGLSSLGLPDFEFRFADYNPQEIAGLLFNYGAYIFENGVVIEHGNTIEGVEANEKLKCYFNHSQLEPKRVVIEINKGD
ncbi:DUF4261 domain-containing protein [Zobellia galactanivorans]|uniref:DUF4261 domain-containing protein n=1 Tax=Zobellia galactanivorans (strain DSM 12802 / CCUG 47099 / CIP 106680 / NCIMB 13871 / Dsij) TaxID=63186 RepID=UPI0026E24352|nr:DUF4261 domain-containing protein [Zobellia galactanivorans]MDO6808931.1 DUF4261 domain-containing protein [Zobellia galactanivorans]